MFFEYKCFFKRTYSGGPLKVSSGIIRFILNNEKEKVYL